MKFRPVDFDAIIFDLGGVILNLDYNKTIAGFENLGMKNFQEYYAQAQQDAVFDNYETGSITSDEFRAYFRETIDSNLSDSAIDNAWNEMLLDLPSHRIELLKNIKDQTRIYLFSNTNAIHLEAFKNIIQDAYGNANLLEETFLETYYSHIVGERKPNAAAFNKVLRDHQLQPEKVLFVDDSEQHIIGAKNIGINAYHLVNEDISQIFDLN